MAKKFLPLFLLVVLAACSSEANECLNFEEQKITISASLEQQNAVETRTELTSSNSVVWSDNDEISVLSNGCNNKFSIETGASSTEATFTGYNLSYASKYYAFYPYDSDASYNGTIISFSLPDIQTYVSGSFGKGSNPAVAVFNSSSDILQFKNICGVLSISLTGSGNLKSINLTSKKSDDYLWGDFTLTANDKIGTDSQTLIHTTDGQGSNSITLDCGTGVTLSATAKEFDIVVPPGSLSSGFDVVFDFIGGDSETISSSNSQTIVRSEKHIMAVQNIVVETKFCLENDVVREFLDYEESNPYVSGTLNASYVGNYYNISTDYRKDRPFPATVSWESSSNSTAQYITVSENSDFSDPYYDKVEIGNSATTYEIYDLIPGRTYYYKVTADVDDENVQLISSYFKTYGRRRMLNIDNTFNVRDMGGIETASGKTIKFGKIFRGGRPNGITSTGAESMNRAGIKAELDLRQDSEAGNITACPFNSSNDYARFPKATYGQYGNYVVDGKGYVFIDAFQWLIDELKKDKPVYFHCAIGADRTGVMGWLVLGLLGAEERQLSLDYELTSFSEAGLRTRTGGGNTYYSAINKVTSDCLDGITYPDCVTTDLQRQFYNYFILGVKGEEETPMAHTISQDDLNWFIVNMTE